jgi:phosphogluconate dehydratase
VPGLFIGALQFGHLPVVFVPAGPMTSGLSNDEKSKIRQKFAQGEVSREELLAAEQAAYHGAGTCTFYGTANSNQMLMEIMGLHLPGSSFVNPGSALREALTCESVKRAVELSQENASTAGMGYQISAEVIVNGIIGLLATGGSTNHTIHLIAMARAAGWIINWDDFSDLSQCIPLLARVYPNGSADVNHFQAAGGMGFLIAQLRQAGLLHDEVQTIMGKGMHLYTQEPWLDQGRLSWRNAPVQSLDTQVLRPVSEPFSADGGLRVLHGNLGRCVVKVSAVKPQHRKVHAPAVVVNDQKELQQRFKAGQLEKDFVAVVRYQGPQANGMPELHKLTPVLGILQDKGFHVALVTDGRMSGASGKVPAAIHVTPEALDSGMIARVQDGDMITLDCDAQSLHLHVDEATLQTRHPTVPDLRSNQRGTGRDLFALMRANAPSAEEGACALLSPIQ